MSVADQIVQVFKSAELRAVVRDAPWDSSLVWADAKEALKELAPAERDSVVRRVLLEFFDDGLVNFYAIKSFEAGEYDRVPESGELFSREQLEDYLRPRGESLGFLLGMRPTDKARRVIVR